MRSPALSSNRHFGLEWLWSPARRSIAYALPLLMAVALVLYLYPGTFLAGHGRFFEGGDAASHVSGWLFFEQDHWHFPLLKTDRLNYPDGISIAFTDSIPLLALPLKLFAGVLPAGFHYFGLWHAICYLLQAAAAVFVIRSLGIRHLPGVLLAAGFALIWPALTHRLGHTALMTQGLLLLTLGTYLRGHSGTWSVRRTCTAFIAITASALLVHPYLFAMSYPLLLVYLVSQWRAGSLDLKRVCLWLAGSLVVLFAILLAGGYLIGKGAAAGGFGIYSLNLLSPFCGGLLCSSHYATPGQDEGFNYLGAGVLLLLATSALLEPRAFLRSAARHRYLLLALLALTLYAASNKVFVGQHELLDIHLPRFAEALAGIFRVSGRFFWLVGYSILFFVLAVLLRRRSLALLLLMSGALALQWYDTRPLRDRVLFQTRLPTTVDIAPWRSALAGFEEIDVYPAYGCSLPPTTDDDYVRYQYLAAQLGLRINTGYTARAATDCTKKNRLVDGPALPGHLYVKLGHLHNPLDLPPLFRTALDAGRCMLDSQHLICMNTRPSQSWATVAAPLDRRNSDLRIRWKAEQLPSLIGQLRNGRLVPRQPGEAGYLSYGPYIALSEGVYSYRINYLSEADEATTVGTWDIVGQDAGGHFVALSSGPLAGTHGELRPVAGMVALKAPLQKVELRLLSNGADLQLSDLEISSGPPAPQTAQRAAD